MKYSYEKKLESVLLVLESGCSARKVARLIGSEQKHIRRWVALYQAHGEEGLRIKRGSYSGDFKLSVITCMYENHLSLFETAVKFGIPNDSVVLSWDRIYRLEGLSGLYQDNRGRMKKPKKPKPSVITGQADIQKELEYLRAENAYLKKLQALVEDRIARESGSAQKPSKD
jgi:transposase